MVTLVGRLADLLEKNIISKKSRAIANAECNQCDQIWQNFATLAECSISFGNFLLLKFYLIKFEPNVANISCCLTTFRCCKWPNMKN